VPADVTLDQEYLVKQADVFLSIIIGEGQIGGTTVFLDDKAILRAGGSFSRLLLGEGADISGQTLTVISSVNDVNKLTNRMSVTYQLDGGAQDAEFVAKGQVTNNNDTLVFQATITLKAAQ
jgi:hypothetical protein